MKIKLILLTFVLASFNYIYADDHVEIAGMEAIQCSFEDEVINIDYIYNQLD